jgi:hypothetical protein
MNEIFLKEISHSSAHEYLSLGKELIYLGSCERGQYLWGLSSYLKWGHVYEVVYSKVINISDSIYIMSHVRSNSNDMQTILVTSSDLHYYLFYPLEKLTEEEQFLVKLGQNFSFKFKK